jgi:excisionase family DNA binding protein
MELPEDESLWPKYITVAEIATVLRVSRMTVYRLVRDGEIKCTRVGRSFRIETADFRAYMDKHTDEE